MQRPSARSLKSSSGTAFPPLGCRRNSRRENGRRNNEKGEGTRGVGKFVKHFWKGFEWEKLGVCPLNHSIGVCVQTKGKIDIYICIRCGVFISEDRSFVNRGNQLW